MSHICPGYIPDISRIYIEAGYIRLIPSLYPAYMREIPAFAMAIPILGREVDRDYLNIKTQPLWQDKSQALVVFSQTDVSSNPKIDIQQHPVFWNFIGTAESEKK